jgi:hypothetical protein
MARPLIGLVSIIIVVTLVKGYIIPDLNMGFRNIDEDIQVITKDGFLRYATSRRRPY